MKSGHFQLKRYNPCLLRKNTKPSAGDYRSRRKEQRRLSKKYSVKVTGATHEAEHVIGFRVLSGGYAKRSENAFARSLENNAPAYQEEKVYHRKHIGTGNKGRDITGFSSGSYRSSCRSLLEQGDVSSAVQLNQLGYAFQFREAERSLLSHQSRESLQSDNSFRYMVENMFAVDYAVDGASTVRIPVDDIDRVEMTLSRETARTGMWPAEGIYRVREVLFGEVT